MNKTHNNNCKRLRAWFKQAGEDKNLHCRLEHGSNKRVRIKICIADLYGERVIKKAASVVDMIINSKDHTHFHKLRHV